MDHLNNGLRHFSTASELARLHHADIRERAGRSRPGRRPWSGTRRTA